jgi:hypothetical protein
MTMLTRAEKPASLQAIANERRHEEARDVRSALFEQCRSILAQLGDDVSGFALIVWDRHGDLRSSYDTGFGPLRPALVPTLAADALNRHVTLDMAPATDERRES